MENGTYIHINGEFYKYDLVINAIKFYKSRPEALELNRLPKDDPKVIEYLNKSRKRYEKGKVKISRFGTYSMEYILESIENYNKSHKGDKQ